jgi:hypothetical protein
MLILVALGALAAAPCRASVAVEDEEVVFTFANASAKTVYVAGDFNGWNPTIDLMEKGPAGFEISLYLLPGTYRYRFIVDGAAESDPDNPCRDAEGHSCFTLVRRGDALAAIMAQTVERAGVESVAPRVVREVGIDAYAEKEDALLTGLWRLRGVVDERIDVDLTVAGTERFLEGEAAAGWTYLLQADASYRSNRGSLGAFTRPERTIDLGDEAGLIGTVGPFRYPVSLFSRGVSYAGSLLPGLDVRALYLSRLRGYRTGLEGTPDSSSLFSSRELEDSDLYGVKIGVKLGRAAVHYLRRGDRRPRDFSWRFPDGDPHLYRGFERDAFQGLSLDLAGDGGVTFDGEILFGRSFLDATGRLETDAGGPADIRALSLERTWEHGRRIVLGVSGRGESLRSRVRFEQTTLEGAPAARDGRPDGTRTALAGNVAVGDSSRSMELSAGTEQFSSSNTGSVFWLSRTDFWLDGDEVSYDLVPFLSSVGLYELRLSFAFGRERLGASPWEKGIALSARQRGDVSGDDPLFREVRLSSGLELSPRVAFLVDLRGASYRYGPIRRDFADAFLALHATVSRRLWCVLGAGVNPDGYDRWLGAFSDHGREDYLYERGVFRALAARGEAAAVRSLIEAEDALADDWVVSFEAGFTF